MPSADRFAAFVATVREGRYVEAIENFYAADAEMRENENPPRLGRDRLVAHEKATLAGTQGVRTLEAGPALSDGDRSVVGWTFEFTLPEGSVRRLKELALQTWRGDRIVSEQFFYDPSQMTAA